MLDDLDSLIASDPEAPFLIAVSGGRDSVVLLDLFSKRFPAERLTVAHYDHRARPESWADRAFVEALASRYGTRFVAGISSQEGPRSEARLRDERLAYLESIDEKYWIVTAHHATDQMETFLLRLLRGTGLSGLAGIPPRRGRFLRPLLAHPREAIVRYVETHGLEFREDASNASPEYARNRVRNEILPILGELSAGHGGLEATAARIAALCGEIRGVTDARRDGLTELLEPTENGVRIKSKVFQALDRESRALLVKSLAPSDGASRPRVLALVDELSEGRNGGQLAGGLRVRRSKGYLHFSQYSPQ